MDFLKNSFGLRLNEPLWSMMAGAPMHSHGVEYMSIINAEEDLSSPITYSPSAFTPMDEHLLHQVVDDDQTPHARSFSNTDDGRSMTSSQLSSGNGATRPDAHAMLKGSPKMLGWEVDEEAEAQVWPMMMNDALEGSVYEQSEDADDETSLMSEMQTKKDLYKNYLRRWDDDQISLVWRVIPSKRGAHKWVLEPRTSSGPVTATTTCEMGTDTSDLIDERHCEAGVQTTIKTHATAQTQTDPAPSPKIVPSQAPKPEGAPFSPRDVETPSEFRPIASFATHEPASGLTVPGGFGSTQSIMFTQSPAASPAPSIKAVIPDMPNPTNVALLSNVPVVATEAPRKEPVTPPVTLGAAATSTAADIASVATQRFYGAVRRFSGWSAV